MHVQTGTVFDGVAFLHLGRTDTRLAHTIPEVTQDGLPKHGTDANTLGRYAVHFHMRSGARITTAPHVVRNSVVFDSPKWGIVNHGGHVLAEDNVTYKIAGSHFVAENGSEIGAFRRNMAVRSTGSGDLLRARMYDVSDFGHQGHGFWLQGGGVEVTHNWTSGQADGAIFVMNDTVKENGLTISFDAKNIGNPPYADETGTLQIGNVNLYIANNTIAGCLSGVNIWDHKVYAKHGELSVVEGSTIFNTPTGLDLSYSKNVALRNLRLIGWSGTIGITGNGTTGNIIAEGLVVEGFSTGIRLPRQGKNVIRNTVLKNDINLEISSANVPSRHIHLDNVTFKSGYGRQNILMQDLVLPDNADAAMLFMDDRIDFTDHQGRNQRLFFPAQQRQAIPFPDHGPQLLRGLTSSNIEEQFGLAFGGTLAPRDAEQVSHSNALATASSLPTDLHGYRPINSQVAMQGSYAMQSEHFEPTPEENVMARWRVVEAGSNKSRIVLNESMPPKFMIQRSLLPLRIHPNDLSYGYLVTGVVIHNFEGSISTIGFMHSFYDLKPDSDGIVRIPFKIQNMAGKETPVELALQVTPEAVERGRNLTFFNQKNYCGKCGWDTTDEDIKHFNETGELAPLDWLNASFPSAAVSQR